MLNSPLAPPPSCKVSDDTNLQQLRFNLCWPGQNNRFYYTLSRTSPLQYICLRSTSLIRWFLSSVGSLQKVSFNHSSSISFHSSSIHWRYHRSSQSQIKGLPKKVKGAKVTIFPFFIFYFPLCCGFSAEKLVEKVAACNQETQQRLCFSTYYECRYVLECQGLVPLIRNATLSACCCKVLSTPSCGGLGRQWEVCLKFWKQSSLLFFFVCQTHGNTEL